MRENSEFFQMTKCKDDFSSKAIELQCSVKLKSSRSYEFESQIHLYPTVQLWPRFIFKKSTAAYFSITISRLFSKLATDCYIE